MAIPRVGFRVTPRGAYLGLSLLILLPLTAEFLFYSPAGHLWGADFWEHAAAMKQLTARPAHPLHPEYATVAPSRDYMPWYLAFATLAHVLSLAPLTAMALLSIADILLILAGIYLFFREYFQNEWAPPIGLVAMVFLWGEPWVWSSFYNFRSLALTGAYPSTFVFGLTFIAWWAGLRMLRAPAHPGPPLLLALAALAALLFLGHQLSGLFAIGGLAILLLFEPAPNPPRRLMLLAALFAGVALSRLWPYFDPGYVFATGGQAGDLWLSDDRFYSTPAILRWAGPALLGLFAIFRFFRTRTYLGTAIGFVAVLAAYVDLRIGGVPQGQRFVLFAIFYLHIALTWVLLSALGSLRGIARSAVILVCAAFVIGQMEISGLEIAGGVLDRDYPALQVYRLHDVTGPMTRLTRNLPDGAVVLSSCRLGLMLPVFAGRVVSICRTSPLVPDDAQRFADTQTFFAEGVSAETRRQILQRYGATYIAFAPGDASAAVAARIGELASEVASTDSMFLLRVR